MIGCGARTSQRDQQPMAQSAALPLCGAIRCSTVRKTILFTGGKRRPSIGACRCAWQGACGRMWQGVRSVCGHVNHATARVDSRQRAGGSDLPPARWLTLSSASGLAPKATSTPPCRALNGQNPVSVALASGHAWAT